MPEHLSRAVADQIRSLMQARQMSGYALAKATGIPQSSISRKLNYAAPFDLADVARIAQVFGVKASDLVAWAERPHQPQE
jgi:transcriptional regulator with XRE-family HTH domain